MRPHLLAALLVGCGSMDFYERGASDVPMPEAQVAPGPTGETHGHDTGLLDTGLPPSTTSPGVPTTGTGSGTGTGTGTTGPTAGAGTGTGSGTGTGTGGATPPGFCVGRLSGDWCDGVDLVSCSADVEIDREPCTHGCTAMPAGTSHECAPDPDFCVGLMNGLWCDGDDLVYCSNDVVTSRTECVNGCVSMPLGTPDACG